MRKINLIMGGKGGVGKTLFACSIFDYCQAQAIPADFYDGETENRTNSLSSIIGCKAVEIRSKRGFDTLLDAIFDESENPVFIDMPAASGQETVEWLLDIKDDLACKITLLCICTSEPSTIEQANRYAEITQCPSVAVLNLFRGEIPADLLKAEYRISIPPIRADLSAALALANETPRQAVAGKLAAKPSDRIPLASWTRKVETQIEEIIELIF